MGLGLLTGLKVCLVEDDHNVLLAAQAPRIGIGVFSDDKSDVLTADLPERCVTTPCRSEQARSYRARGRQCILLWSMPVRPRAAAFTSICCCSPLAFSTVRVSGTWSPSLIWPVRPISITW